MANIIESRVTLEDEVFEETIDTMEEPIEVVRPSSYNDLEDLPQVNGVTLMGNKTSEELGIVTATDIENAVSAEATLRENADTALGGRIDGEKTARENADTALGGRIDGEITNRTNADNALGTRIDNEILARQGGDNNLQTQIDAITSKSDVVDVVADYAALQAYDTQHLGNNDVIKVLDDETHNDAQTYYRWDKTAGTWSYIGSEAPYYSKGQIDQQMQAKQDKLTAGTGISLDGATISADTTVLATKDDLEPEIVADLPAVGDTTKLYLTPTNKTASGNPITIDLKEDVGQITSFRLDGDTFQQSYTGKNKLGFPNMSGTRGGVTYSIVDGLITLNGTSTSSVTVFLPITTLFNLTAGDKAFAIIPVSGSWDGGWMGVSARNSLDTQVTFQQLPYVGTHDSKVRNYTSAMVSQITGFRMFFTSDSSFSNYKFYIQIVDGSTVDYDFEPFVGGQPSPSPSYPQPIQTVTGEQTVTINSTNYPISLGSIELCKLGDYQDYIYKSGDDWKVHKTVGKILLGEFDYSYYSNTIYYITNASAALGINTSTDTQLYSECFTGSRDSSVTNRMFYGSANNRFNIYPDAAFMTTYNTVDKFKKWLNDNSIHLYYIVATPTDTTITDATLIAQLEAVRKATLANGQNTITNVATGANLAGSMSIGYYGYNPSEYSEWRYIDGAWEQVGGRPFPTNISEFNNDANFVSENELQGIIAPKLQPEIVNELPAQGEEGKLYLTPKNYTRSTTTGNPILATITDGAGQIESFQLDGDTEQQTYDGKNLFDGTWRRGQYDNGAWHPDAFDGERATTGLIPVTGGDYSISLNSDTLYTSFININYFDADKNWLGNRSTLGLDPFSDTDRTRSFTLPNTAYYLAVSLRPYRGYSGQTVYANAPSQMLQVERNLTVTSYEPYVGGVPSPNPDYPQAIQTVTGLQTVEIVGRNLFDKNTMTLSNISVNPNVNAANGYTSVYVPCLPDTTYTVSKAQETTRFYVATTEVLPAAGVSGTAVSSSATGTVKTFTTGSSAKYIVVMVRSSSDTLTEEQVVAGVQIELGSTASPYTPYSKQTLPISLGSIELCKLGDYQDYIYKSGSDWKVHKATAKYTITGGASETWARSGQTTSKLFVAALTNASTLFGIPSDSISQTKSNYFRYNESKAVGVMQPTTPNSAGIMSYLWLCFDTTSIPDINTAVTWITTNKPQIYYPLATATDTTITDQTLIAQLEAVRNATLQASNTITNTATGSNLAGDLELGYYEYDPQNRYNKWLWLDLNNNYEKLGS